MGKPVLVVIRTVRAIMRARVVGLAAESAFFSLLSLPSLLLGLIGTLGHLSPVLGGDTVTEIRTWLLDLAATALTRSTVDSLVAPMVDDFLGGAQGGILSVTFVVSLWSGSRAMNVFIDAITIAYGLDGLRGYVRQRVLAFVAYLGGLLFALVVLPVLVAGPNIVHRLLPATVGHLGFAYWPVVGLLSTAAVTLLYMLSTPVRTPLWRYLPGALVAMAILVTGSVLLRVYLDASFGEVSIYGSLAAPIAILAWLWIMAAAVLTGSALNAEIDAMWPTTRTAAARAEIAARRQARAARMVERHEQALRTVTAPKPEDGGPEEPKRRRIAPVAEAADVQRAESEDEKAAPHPVEEGGAAVEPQDQRPDGSRGTAPGSDGGGSGPASS